MENSYVKGLKTVLIKLNSNKKTFIQWIPAHIKLEENEKADTLTKSGRTNSQDNGRWQQVGYKPRTEQQPMHTQQDQAAMQ